MKLYPKYAISLGFSLIFSIFTVMQTHASYHSTPAGLEAHFAAGPVIIDTLDYELLGDATGVQFFKDAIIILSNTRYNQKMVADHVAFGQDATFLVSNGDLNSFNNKTFVAANPFPVNPGGLSFSKDYNMMYFTGPDKRNRGTEKIYSVPLDNSRNAFQASFNPSDIEILSFCSGNDNFRHPAVSPDDSFMVFASDKSGGSGGYDLYLVKQDGSKWGNPVNLGKEINTSKDELYPFIDKDNNLFFSSEGHSGFGGFDIYMCKYLEGGWGSPVNLMNTINSENDDIALKMDRENRFGYFTSVIESGKNNKELYRIGLQRSGDLAEAIFMQTQNKYDDLFGEETAVSETEKVTTPVMTDVGTDEASTQTVSSVPAKSPGEIAAATGAAAATVATTAAVTEERENTEKQTTPPLQEKTEEQKVVQPVEPVPEQVQEEDSKDQVVFRVQIVSTSSKKTDYRVTVDGKSYPTFVYNYKGAYRYCVGEFKTVSEANSFKNKCRSSGFDQAFVAAFVNDERVTDPSYFK